MGLRKKATLNGWTKRAYAEARAAGEDAPPARMAGTAAERPTGVVEDEGPAPTPALVVQTAIARTGRALMRGDGVEAQALVRATEGYLRLNVTVHRDGWTGTGDGTEPGRQVALAFLADQYRQLNDLPEDAIVTECDIARQFRERD